MPKYKYILAFLLINIFTSASASETANINISGGYVLVLYADVTLLRRGLDSAQMIGEGKEDYIVKIGCMGRADCIAKIKSIYDLISTKENSPVPCSTTAYARVSVNPDSVSYGENEKNEIETYDIDHTGRCIRYRGNSYKIKKSIFAILNKKPVISWSH